MHQETCLGSPSAPCIQAIIRRSPILQTRKLRPREVTKAWRSTLPSENVNPGPQDSRTSVSTSHGLLDGRQGQWWERKEGKNGFLVINGPPSDDHSFIHKALWSTSTLRGGPQDATMNKVTMHHFETMGRYTVCRAMENSARRPCSQWKDGGVVAKRN